MRLTGVVQAGAVVVVCAVSGCQLPLVQGAPTPAQSVTAALRELETARSVRMQGELTRGDRHYAVNLSSDDAGNVDGLVLPDRAPEVMVAGSSQRLLLKSEPYFLQMWGVVTGTRWVVAPDDPISGLVRTLTKRDELVKALRDAIGTDLEQKPGTDPDGTRTITYTGTRSGVSLIVPASGPPRPLHIATVPAHPLGNNLSDVGLRLMEYGKAVAPEMPAKYADMADRNTLPVNIVVDPAGAFSWDACDRAGCTMSRSVRNDGGRESTASATATFTVTRDSAGVQVLGSCTVTVPPLWNRQTTRVSCRAAFDSTGSYWGKVTIDNPIG